MNTEITSKQQLADKIKSSSNILVTVSRNPSVDELASAIALTLALDKLDKHATAVFSGDIPPAINFLEPEKTFENNADSLRDFVISLDKDKADRLRFKPDGDMVRIYITPYKTKLSADDLSFSDGEFNIELVVAIGVDNRDELDDAIASHGRILHSAIAATIGLDEQKDQLGTISWQDKNSSSYSEMIDSLITGLSGAKDFIDSQIATALLTGIVSATEQFRNAKTSASVMTIAANLMAKGANQQLIASELSGAEVAAQPNANPDKPVRDGIEISHELDNGETWNQVKDQASQLATEDAKIADTNAQAAIRETQTQLREIAPPAASVPSPVSMPMPPSAESPIIPASSITTPTLATPPINSDLPPVQPPIAGTAELDNLIARASSSAQAIDDIKNLNNPDLSHGAPYINNSISPINSALMDEDADTTPAGPNINNADFGDDTHLVITPPNPTGTNLPIASQENNQSISANPTLSFSPDPSSVSTIPGAAIDSLPPLPPLNSDAPSIEDLTRSATEAATKPIEPTTPAPIANPIASPMINNAPAPTNDPSQFQIPGM